MKRILIFILPWLFFSACTTHYPYEYIIAGLTLYNQDNSGTAPVDATTSDIPAKAYAIRLEFSNVLTNPDKYHNDESYHKMLNPVKSLYITSLTDFDNAHPAGSLLNSYFLYGANTYEVSAEDSIQARIKNIGRETYRDYERLPETWKTNDYLLLMQPPAYYGNRSFVIHMEMKDSTSITDTITVNLRP